MIIPSHESHFSNVIARFWLALNVSIHLRIGNAVYIRMFCMSVIACTLKYCTYVRM